MGDGVVQLLRPPGVTGWHSTQVRRGYGLYSAAGPEPSGAQSFGTGGWQCPAFGCVPSLHPELWDQPWDRNCLCSGRRVDICATATQGRTGSGNTAGQRTSRDCPMRIPPFPRGGRRRLPLQLLLLLLPWPVWTQAPATPAASWGTPVALGCPEACVCAPGGQANCSGRALPAVPGGLNRRVHVLLLNHNRVHALPPGAFVDAGALSAWTCARMDCAGCTRGPSGAWARWSS